MADTQRTVGVKLKIDQEGDAGAFKEVAEGLGELDQAAADATGPVDEAAEAIESATVAAEGLPAALSGAAVSAGELATAAGDAAEGAGELAESVEEMGKASKGATDPARLLKGDLREMSQAASAAGIDLGKLIPILASFTIAKEAAGAVGSLVDGFNRLAREAGATHDVLDTFMGMPFVPFLQDMADSIVSAKMQWEENNGALEEQIAAHEKAREAFLATRTATEELTAAVDAASEAERRLGEAAQAAAAQQAEFGKMLEDSARRTREEMAKNEELAAAEAEKRDAARKQRMEESAAADAAALERIAAAHQQLMDALSQTPDTSGIDAMTDSVNGLAAACDQAQGRVMALFSIDPETGTGMGSEDRAETMRNLLDERVAGMRGGSGG